MREDDSVTEIQPSKIKLLKVTGEERQISRSDLKFELVTTISSPQLR